MKKATIMMAIMLSGCASFHPKTPDPVNLAPAIADVDKADQSLSKALQSHEQKQIVQQVQSAKQDLQEVKQSLFAEQSLSRKLAEDRDWWMQHSEDQDKEIAQLKEKLSHFNHLLFIASSLFGILAGIIVGRIGMSLSPYGAWIGVGAGALAFGSAWQLLAHL
jgi:hypothetical protein